jgi:amidase
LRDGDGLALAAAIRDGRTTAVAAMEVALERAEEVGDLNALHLLAAERGRKAAAAVDAGLKRRPRYWQLKPFAGVPFLMKDLGANAAGFPIHAGLAALAARALLEPGEAELATRFRERAGLVAFGTTKVPELAISIDSGPGIGPVARNPLDPARTPGGSSAGAAVAVAAGIVAVSHATDAYGSIRVPAACCGLVGLKPTRGAVPGGPGFGNHLNGIAGELIVSRSLRDTAAMLDAVGGAAEGPYPDPDLDGPVFDALDTAVESLRIGIVEPGPEDASRRAAVDAAGAVLARVGHRLVSLRVEPLAALERDSVTVLDRILSANMARFLRDLGPFQPGELSAISLAMGARGAALSAADLQDADVLMARVAHTLWRLFDEVDVLLLPMLATAPPKLGFLPLDHDDVDLHWQRMAAFSPYAALANVGGVPALTLPFGRDGDGLPLPVQLVGPMASDGLLLRLGRLLEVARPFRHAAPIAGLPA